MTAPVLLEPLLVWGLLPRFIGLSFILAFSSLLPQIVLLAGSESPMPVHHKLDILRRDYGAWQRFTLFPTLLWFNASDNALRALCVGGIFLGGVVVVGGPAGPYALLACWLFYLSIDSGNLSFPWDNLLLEMGFLGAFLPATHYLPTFTTTSLPSPLLAFAVHFLAARLMLGFAKVKFVGSSKQDRLYLKAFFVWMPMPHPLGLWLYRAPDIFHRASLVFMFVAEVICPILILFPGWPRLVGAAGLVGLMVGIHFTGNWGFFNIAYILLCVSCLDVTTSLAAFSLSEATASASSIARHVVVLFLVGYGAFLLLALNSWVSRSWVYWPLFEKLAAKMSAVGVIMAIIRRITSSRVVNSYGVFPPKISPAIRLTPVLEGSDDGETWKRFHYRYLVSHTHQRAPMVAPHHPRLDQAVPYSGGGLGDDAFLGSLVGTATPVTTYLRYGQLNQALQKILQDTKFADNALGSNPFKDKPPAFVRLRMVAFHPTSPADKKASGQSFYERDVGEIVGTTGIRPEVIARGQGAPECNHPDLVYWKSRAKPLRAMCDAFENGAALEDALIEMSALQPDDDDNNDIGLTRKDVTQFFEEALPFMQTSLREFSNLDTTILRGEEFAKLFTGDELHNFERILERSAWLLRTALLPHLWGNKAPKVERQPAFRTHLNLQRLIVEGGLEGLRRALEDPASIVHQFKLPSDDDDARAFRERQLVVLTHFRPDIIELTARTFRWNTVGDLIGSDKLPSVLEYADIFVDIIPRGEVWRPQFDRLENGSYDVEKEFSLGL